MAEGPIPTMRPVPPIEETTAAPAGISVPREPAGPLRPELTAEHGDGAEPRPRTLATQEIRLALAFTGGVSLAVWMGGVARELDLLVQASGRRRMVGEPADPTTPDADQPVRRFYRRLLDVVDAEVAVDVLAGTSAGGINAALLGLVNARRLDLGSLRDVWLREGDFGLLLRDPKEKAPPSLLKGDDQLLSGLTEAIRAITHGAALPPQPRVTDVFIPTTFLSPEISAFADDYGTQIADADHHGLFHFDARALMDLRVGPRLALASRSSASFPGAFEPSFVPFGDPADPDDDAHPDMRSWSNATRSHWAADGGLLVNRPLGPLLQTVFDRGADREVRRALLYVVPTSGPAAAMPDDAQTRPLGLAASLQRDLGAVLNQSIAADLAAIKEHNDRTRAAADTRLRLAALGTRLPPGSGLADAGAWQDYRDRQGDWLVSPLIAELSRQLGDLGPARPPAWVLGPDRQQDADLRRTARETATHGWPDAPPADPLPAVAVLGRSAFDGAKATVLRLLRLGSALATTVEERNCLARLGTHLHQALPTSQSDDLRAFVGRSLAAADRSAPLTTVVQQLAADYAAAQGTAAELTAAWQAVGSLVGDAVPLLEGLASATLRMPADSATSLHGRRRRAAEELTTYLAFLARGDAIAQLLDLHVAVRSVLPVLTEVQQRVELVQVSADTRTLLAPGHDRACTKLTGLQLYHFGAFYKTSWRANDWMWGRLDGCGWLVHVLLDPRRLIAVLENDGVPCGSRRAMVLARLLTALELPATVQVPSEVRDELAFLDAELASLPASLPGTALWVAAVLQQQIAVEELPALAATVVGRPLSADAVPMAQPKTRPTLAERAWVTRVDRTDWATATPDTVGELLDTCPVPRQSIAAEAESRTPLFLRTASKALAVTTSAATTTGTPPTALRPTFATARTATRTAYLATDTTMGVRRWMTLVGLGLIAYGGVALLTDITVLGLTGIVAFVAGAIVLAFVLGRLSVDALRILLALLLIALAAAPWLPWLDDRIFPWLENTALPWLADTAVPWLEANRWVWPVILFLVILPPFTAIADLVRRVRHRRRPPRPVSPMTPPAADDAEPEQGPGSPAGTEPRPPDAERALQLAQGPTAAEPSDPGRPSGG